MLQRVLNKVFGSKNDRELKKLWPLVDAINKKEESMRTLSDAQLQAMTVQFKEKIAQGASLDDFLIDAFALVRESSVRILGMRHFDVQLLGGIALHQGKISEMKTGEGKTLTGTLPVYLNALTGRGVHVVTVNDYLAKRDAEWMSRIYGFLGLSTGCVLAGLEARERQDAYNSDITYGQNNEFGFDYLRDNMKMDISERAQRGHYYAIVDEVDSILIDEARTPLIISGPSEKPTKTYQIADQVVRKLSQERDYTTELKSKQTTLTEEGVFAVEKLLGITNLYEPENIELVHHVQQALKAHVTMKRDIDYVVRGGQIIIVDEFTGRLMAGRRWSDGLHQAVEAKEGVEIQRESETLATITFQNYFRLYEKLSGMTGTADTEAEEFKKIYKLDVVVLPTNLPMVREDRGDIVYITEPSKFKGAVTAIKEAHEKGQPVLVGTGSIEKSELLSELLKREGVKHNVLNAKQHEQEAEIVAQAGRIGSVTISTNMAGRGTDIILGGNPEFLAYAEAGTRDPEDAVYKESLNKYKESCSEEKKKVLELGGLCIIGTERHESRRIDNQLRGRAGRQGDPGVSQFFISLEDDLMKRFGGEKLQSMMLKVAGDTDEGIQGWTISNSIERAQKRVEGHHFDMRKHVLEFDDVLNKQRQVVYGMREQVLREELKEEQIQELFGDVIESIVLSYVHEKTPVVDWDLESLLKEYASVFGFEAPSDVFKELQDIGSRDLAQVLYDDLLTFAKERLDSRCKQIGTDRMMYFSKVIYLQAINHFWKEHLTLMEHVREGVYYKRYMQKNPLHEYQREGYEAFGRMMLGIQKSVVQHVMLAEIPTAEEIAKIEEQEKEAVRRREEAASEIHADASSGKDSSESDQGGSGNRQQRRAQQKLQGVTMTKSDYAPSKPSSTSKKKKK